MRQVWLAIIGLWVSAVLLLGCGNQNAGSSAEGQATQTVTERAAAAPELTVQQATDAVREHYRALNRGQFATAWSDLSRALQAQLGPVATFQAGYDLTEGTYVDSATGRPLSGGQVAVDVQFHSDDIDACGNHISQLFGGTWTVAAASGNPILAIARITKSSGPDPVRNVTDCSTLKSPAPPPPSYSPPTSLPDPYSPPPSEVDAFCATHDCIPNFPNGNGYIVQCQDGTYSHSGGIQGACSWHGGVAY
jgi:hypothetical protein